MNRNLIIGITIAVILLLGGYFLLANRNTSKVSKEEINITATSTPLPEKSLNTLKDLFSSGTSQSCSFSTAASGVQSTGTVFVSDKKMRGDFDSQIEGKTVKSHMVIIDNTSYLWSDGQSQGVKMSFDDSDLENAEELANKANLDINAEMDYDCDSWSPDNSMFTLPKNITFASLDEMMRNLPTGTSDQCSSCESLTGESKTQCLVALKCN